MLEEPEMSLNAAVVSRLAPMIARATQKSGRQVLITTHAAEIMSDSVALSEVHLLDVGAQGTELKSASSIDDVKLLVDGGVPVGEAVLPKTKAKDVGKLAQLDLFAS